MQGLSLAGLSLGLLLVTGCAAVSVDLQAASKRLHAAQAAGLLGPNDPAPMCVDYLAGAVTPTGPLASVLGGPFAGVVDLGAGVYILDAMGHAGGSSDVLDQKCGPVALKLLKSGARRLPGF